MNEENLYKLAQIYACYAEIEGMKAENKQREIQGESMTYTMDDFNFVQDQLIDLGNPNY